MSITVALCYQCFEAVHPKACSYHTSYQCCVADIALLDCFSDSYFLNVFQSVFASLKYQTAKKRENTFSNLLSKLKVGSSFLWCSVCAKMCSASLSSCWVSLSAREKPCLYFFFWCMCVLEPDCNYRMQFSSESFQSYPLARSLSSSQPLLS